jgi:hypothetical protein
MLDYLELSNCLTSENIMIYTTNSIKDIQEIFKKNIEKL